MRVREASGDIVVVAAGAQERGESGASRRGQSGPVRWRGRRGQSGPVRWRGRRAQSGPVRWRLVRVQESMCSSRLRGPAPVRARVLVHLACALVGPSQSVRFSVCVFVARLGASSRARSSRELAPRLIPLSRNAGYVVCLCAQCVFVFVFVFVCLC